MGHSKLVVARASCAAVSSTYGWQGRAGFCAILGTNSCQKVFGMPFQGERLCRHLTEGVARALPSSTMVQPFGLPSRRSMPSSQQGGRRRVRGESARNCIVDGCHGVGRQGLTIKVVTCESSNIS